MSSPCRAWKPLFGLAALALAAAAPAQDGRTDIGSWRLSEVGGKVACTVRLTDLASIPASPGVRQAEAQFACRQAFPPLQSLAAWRTDEKGDIVLADAGGKALAVFIGQPGGDFEAKAPDGKLWRLESAHKTPKPTPSSPVGASS
ncbi:MAG: AprI/Inh family metalloprotease inhibitor [Caulobacteraceae bacterium]